ncbi:MAG: hypothetical protein RL033_341 [Pseudomonadota bacterium]
MNILQVIKDAKLKTKLLAMTLIPVLGLSFFGGDFVLTRLSTARDAALIAELAEFGVKVGSLVHETQRERGTTSLYLTSGGKGFQAELETQRRETDRALRELQQYLTIHESKLPEGTRQDVEAGRAQLTGLERIRTRASSVELEPKESFSFYSALNEILLESVQVIDTAASDVSLARLGQAYVALLRAKETAGMERAQLANVFSNKAFAANQLLAVEDLSSRQASLLGTFAEFTSAELRATYESKSRSDVFRRVKELARNALESDASHPISAEPKAWFEASTARIDVLKELEDAQAGALRERVVSERSSSVSSLVLALILWLGLTALALLQAVVLMRQITEPVRRTLAALAGVANGDLSTQLEVNSADEFGQITQALNQAIGSVRSALGQVRTVATDVTAASEQLASASDDISSGAQEQAASLEETAASLEQIASTVKQNSENATHAAKLATGSREVAERGGRVVESAVTAMGEITASSRRIADIISTIDEIAFQTNLLALNAAVEAARAGDQGRGFAVVAAEVRSLAQRSAAAAKEIKGLINDSVGKINTGSQHVGDSGRSLEEIVTSVKRMTDVVGEIAAASREQNTGIDQVTSAVTQMDQVTQANAAQTEEMSSTASALAEQARQLRSLVARFRLGDEASTSAEQPGSPPESVPLSQTRAAAGARPRPQPAARRAAGGGNTPKGFQEF